VVFHLASYFWIPGILFTIIIGFLLLALRGFAREDVEVS